MTLMVGVVIDPWDYPFNGTVVSTRRFIDALDDQIDFRLLVTPHPEKPVDRRLVSFNKLSIPGFNGIIESMKVPLANPWFCSDTLKAAIQDLDLLHVQFPFFLGYKASKVANQMGVPLVCSFHVQPENLLRNLHLNFGWLTTLLYKIFIGTIYKRAALVIAPSEFAKQQLLEHGLKVPIEVLSNGVPERFLTLERSTTSKQYFDLLTVGRMAPEKHQDHILSAIARSKYKEQIRLTMIGTGPLEASLIELAAKLGVNAAIGPVDDDTLLAHYSSADLFIHGGEIELEGMSVLEAMAAGNAVLVSDSNKSATRHFVSEPDAQFRHADIADLSEKLDVWLASEQKRSDAGKRNRTFAQQRNHRKSIDQLHEIYRRNRRSRC